MPVALDSSLNKSHFRLPTIPLVVVVLNVLAIAYVGSDSIPTRNPSQATNDMSATAITESDSRIRNEEIGGEIANIAPEFGGLNGWINGGPLTIKDLRGQVVLVDF